MQHPDEYLNYYVVVESQNDSNDFKVLDVSDKNGCNFLRFYSCLQTFGKRNQNRRLWQGTHIKQSINASGVMDAIARGRFVGENGHPVPATGQVTMERILTIDPNNTPHRITQLDWVTENKLCGIIETLDEGPGSPGYRFMKNILQGIDPAFSLRSIVPQRKNPDGSIDVVGPGRVVCYDRVYFPSHEEANIDKSIPVKNIITKPNFEVVMESFSSIVLERSEKVNRIIDKLEPAIESVTLEKSGLLGINTNEGRIFIAPETKFRREITDIMKNF